MTQLTLCVSLLTENENIEDVINNELIKLCDWFKADKLSLNASKTKAMIFHTINKKVYKPSVNIDNKLIEIVDSFEFLGFALQKYLKWSLHIEKISQKMSKVVGVLNRLKNFLPMKSQLLYINNLPLHL